MSRLKLALCVALLGVVVTTAVAVAGGRSSLRAELSGFEEVPFVSTDGNGTFRAALDHSSGMIHYRLTYADLSGAVEQAHIHLGQQLVNGGIAVWLCGNIATTPTGVQPCPDAPAAVTGSFGPEHVVGPATQGLVPGEPSTFEELVRAMRSGVTYANVHTKPSPGGEIRGQIDGSDRRGHDED